MKTCNICNETKSLDSFEKHRHQCRSCRNTKRKTFGTRSGDGLRNYRLQNLYGIDLNIYKKMLQEQNGVCKICKSGEGETLSVDHCHKTGKVRSLLCSMCNKGLGQFKDNQDLLKEAIEYLKHHSFES